MLASVSISLHWRPTSSPRSAQPMGPGACRGVLCPSARRTGRLPGARRPGWARTLYLIFRGSSLHFIRVSEKKGIGILTRQYQAIAKKNGSRADYQITDTMPFPPNNVQMKPMLVVETSGVMRAAKLLELQ
jgi:hypothetical protein